MYHGCVIDLLDATTTTNSTAYLFLDTMADKCLAEQPLNLLEIRPTHVMCGFGKYSEKYRTIDHRR